MGNLNMAAIAKEFIDICKGLPTYDEATETLDFAEDCGFVIAKLEAKYGQSLSFLLDIQV